MTAWGATMETAETIVYRLLDDLTRLVWIKTVVNDVESRSRQVHIRPHVGVRR